jgi:hypothetical protein
MNNNLEAIVVLVDEKFNIVTIKDGSNTSFIKTKIELKDYPFDNNDEMAAKNAIIRHLKDVYSLFITSNRLFNASLVDDNGNKTYLLIYKLDTTEKMTLQMSPNVMYVSISNLPQSLNPVSSTIAVSITNYFDIFKKTPNPPGIITINYPVQVPIYVPVQPVTLLKPVIFFQPRQFPLPPPPPPQQQPTEQPPKKLIHLSDFSSESENPKVGKRLSPKVERNISEKKSSPRIVKPLSEKKSSPRIVKPLSEKKSSPRIVKPLSEKKSSPRIVSERSAINKAKGLERQKTTPRSEIISERKKRKEEKKSSKSTRKSSSSRSSSRKSSSSRSSSRKSSSSKSSSRKSSKRRSTSSSSSSPRRSTSKSSSSSPKKQSPKKQSPKVVSSKRSTPRKKNRKDKKGGYYDKYLKYKMKYLKLQRDYIDLQKKNL